MLTSRILIWTLLVTAHLAFFAYQMVEWRPYLSDSYEYLAVAENLAGHGVAYAGDLAEPRDLALYTKRPPMYPLMLAVTGSAAGLPAITLFFQNLLSLLNLLLVGRLLRNLGLLDGYRWVLLLLLLYPAQLVYANMVMSEILLQTFLTLSVYTLVRYLTGGRAAYLAAYNLLLVGAALTKPVMYLFVVPNLVLMLYVARRRRTYRPVLIGVIPVVLVMAYCGWNAQRTGLFHFSSIQSTSLLDYNTRYLLVHTDGPEVSEALIDSVHDAASSAETFAGRQKQLHAGAWDLLRPRLPAYTLFHARGLVPFFIDPGRFDIYNFFGIRSEPEGLLYYYSLHGLAGVWTYLRTQPVALVIFLMLVAGVNLAKGICLPFAAVSRHASPEVRAGLLLPIFYVAVLTGPIGASRFAVPVFPLMLVAVALAAAYGRRGLRGPTTIELPS